ncbi:hypothetical protein PIIN_00553 [Serendipita indica DSM 11827]|uniref:Ion transport domain-containing protein n=1 Tax=Serendipita indica (strain DSM 11827) TaxID=1109443 RepID=G4U2R8_SERID|nr:hypothetical protein PIIN_00553 [Serendipita indica DSM 11827]
MSYQPVTDSELDDELEALSSGPNQSQGTRSHYALSSREAAKGIASRIVYSQYYVIIYVALAAMATTTVVLSLTDGCPGFAFYILEIIINIAMIAEVSIRFVAFGKQFWKSPFNVVDLGLTVLCVITLVVIFFSGCNELSKEEELLDTFLLVARNVLQFTRLATVMRRSGRSIFAQPKPIDLNAPRSSRLDIDLSDEEAEIGYGPSRVEFDADTPYIRAPIPPRAENVWAR